MSNEGHGTRTNNTVSRGRSRNRSDDSDDDTTWEDVDNMSVEEEELYSDDEHHDDSDYDDEYEYVDDEMDDDGQPIIREGSFWVQHTIALLIGLLAALVGFVQYSNDPSLVTHQLLESIPFLKIPDTLRLTNTHAGARTQNTPGSDSNTNDEGVDSHSRGTKRGYYKRTLGFKFCLEESETNKHSQMLKNKRKESDNDTEVKTVYMDEVFCSIYQSMMEQDIGETYNAKDSVWLRRAQTNSLQRTDSDPNLKPIQFHVPLTLLPTLLSYYYEDYQHSNDARSIDIDSFPSTTAAGKSYRVGHGLVYISPTIASFYQQQPNVMPHISNLGAGSSSSNQELQAVTPTYTGFAAKFINLSPKPIHLYWDAAENELPTQLTPNTKKPKLATIAPFESFGTSTFPGHQFFVTPTYDYTSPLQRFIATADEPVLYYDPFTNSDPYAGSTKIEKELLQLSNEHRQLYNQHLLNRAYGRDYLVATKRAWLGMFPRPRPLHFMHPARFFQQQHSIATSQTHFHSIPSELTDVIETGTRRLGDEWKAVPEDGVALKTHRSGNDNELELSLRVVSCAPKVFEIDNFLSDVEAQHLMDIAKVRGGMTRSTVLGSMAGDEQKKKKDKMEMNTRTSTNSWIEREASPIVDAIYRRVADVLQMDEALLRDRIVYPQSRPTNQNNDDNDDVTQMSLAESIQIVKYESGQQYAPHHDFIIPPTTSLYQPTRFATLIFYLNDDYTGGQTTFPRSVNSKNHEGVGVQPVKNKAVLFYSVLEDGNMDDLSQHSGTPVLEGTKWMANLWIWDPVIH